jgi:hypothetical protein
MNVTDFGRGAAADLRRWAHATLLQHQADDALPTSLRHLFYEAVMAGIVAKGDPAKKSKGRRPDQNLTDATLWLRKQGIVPWEWIEDRTRHLMDFRGEGETIIDGIAAILDGIRIDPWDDVQPLVVVESESGAGVLARIAHDYRVPVIPTRGQTTGWLRTTVSRTVGDDPVVVGYIGDADKAGDDIEKNTERVLRDVLDVQKWERVALTWTQVRAHSLPTVERTDGRDGITRDVCELEALPQRLLLADVESFLTDWLTVDLDDVHERERDQRRAVAELLGIDWDD